MIKKRLINLLSHAKKYIYFNVFFQWIALCMQIGIAVLTGHLLQQAVQENIAPARLIKTALIFFSLIIVKSGATYFSTRMAFFAGKDVKMLLREKIYAKLLRLGASYQEQLATSEVVQVAAEGVEQLEIYFGRYLPQFFYSLLAPLTLFAVLAPISLHSAAVLLFCVPLIPISIIAVQKIAKRLLKKYWGMYTGLGDHFLENLQGLTTLKIYQADGRKSQEMNADAEHFRRITMKVLTMQLNSITVMDIIAYGGAAAGIMTVLYQFSAIEIPLSAAVTIILLAAEFFIPLRLLGSFFHIAMNGMAASDKIFALLDLPEPVAGMVYNTPVGLHTAAGTDNTAAVPPKDAALTAQNTPADYILHTGQMDIRIENLCFGYTKERQIIKNADMMIKSGSFVSIVGESGSGKSTIARIIAGKHKNYTGMVQLGTTDIRSISDESIMRHITTVKHNSYLFKGTVAENLRLAKQEASDEELFAVLKKVNLYDFIESQNGLNTMLLEKAANLSGGQCQRLALARALLADTPIYIFDEAASNIDMESEAVIMQIIYELKKTKTVILISHRLANSVHADCIYFIENGVITEHGTHQELCTQNGAYSRLFSSQRQLELYGEE
ncbi:MAG: ABC transporter ATP-binding protein/permease [Treponema sp.]